MKSNGILLSPEWYDEITPTLEAGKYVVRRGDSYNVIDNNLRLANRMWQDTTEGLPQMKPIASASGSRGRRNCFNVQAYDMVWVNHDGSIVECYVLSHSGSKLTILWPKDGKRMVEAKEIEIRYNNSGDSIPTPMGQLYFNKPGL